MIQKECFDKEWIDKVCSTHKFRHPALVEKVIRAFSLLEMLVKEGCPLTFKGGTSLLLILGGTARRLSIDIDVLCPPGTDIEQYLQHCDKYGFTDCIVIRREHGNENVPKNATRQSHSQSHAKHLRIPLFIGRKIFSKR